ncbi:unnamed protein product [Dicrocoelium dendriticum]|nr:unnamed protein product [Dicrocoelium dendriticum]
MNGEIDVLPQTALRKIKSGSGSLSSGHTGSSIQLPTTNSNVYSSLLDCHEFRNSSSGILSIGSDPSFDDNYDDTPDDTGDSHLSSVLFSSRAASSDSSLLSPTLTAAVDSSNLDTYKMTESGLSPGASVFDSLMGNQSLPIPKPSTCYQPEVAEEKLACHPNRLDDLKNGVVSSDNNACCGDPAFLQTSRTGDTCDDSVPKFLFSVNNLEDFQLAPLQHESQHQKLDPGTYSFQNGSYKSNQRSLQAGDISFNVSEREPFVPPVTAWMKSADSTQQSGDLTSFTFPSDNLPQLLANPLTDHPASTFDNVLSSLPCSSVASAAARRAITGGHNSTRFSPASRQTVWNNTTSGPGSALGSVTGNWNSAGSYAAKASSNVSGVSSLISSPSNNSALWNQMLNNPLGQAKSSSITSMLGNLSLGNGSVTENSSNRSHSNCTGTPLNSGFHPTNINKNAFGAGLSNVYSMFPKRPQHRMMAHWQQQQHHHNPGTHQNQTSKNSGTLQAETLQLVNGNRIPHEGLEMISGTGAAGDVSSVLSYNNNCSLLHSLPTIAPSSTINSLSSIPADSFSSIVPPTNSSNDSASLDTFKFGLDQHLMEVIKSLESNGLSNNGSMGSNTNNNNDGTNIGTLDEVVIPSFNEVDQQFPSLAGVNQLPVVGANAITSGVPGLGGMGCTAFRNVSGPSLFGSVGMPHVYSMFPSIPSREEGYSRKVFVGGLPPDIDEEEITTAFRRFGPLIVDWPHKTESKAYFPPKGYCFLLFQDERSVQSLIGACIVDEGKYYWCVSSPTMKDKPVQIRPWNLADSDFVMDGSQPLDPRKTIFVGGVPRPLRAIELALIMDRLYSGVCYAGIDTDPELKYPKGAGRVAFSNQQSYIAAISARFVQLQHNEIDKRVM